MLPIRLDMIYKGRQYSIGLIEPDEYTLVRMKDEAVKITSEDGLNTPEKVFLVVTNPENKVKAILDSDSNLKLMLAIHDSLGIIKFEVEVLATFLPDLPLVGVPKKLNSFGVQFSGDCTTHLNQLRNEPLNRDKNVAENNGSSAEVDIHIGASLDKGSNALSDDVVKGVIAGAKEGIQINSDVDGSLSDNGKEPPLLMSLALQNLWIILNYMNIS